MQRNTHLKCRRCLIKHSNKKLLSFRKIVDYECRLISTALVQIFIILTTSYTRLGMSLCFVKVIQYYSRCRANVT
jgi:hypothetical protein